MVVDEPGTADGAPEALDALARMETELAMLTRTLEGMSRRSTLYRDLDRASYVLARTLATEAPVSINGLAELVGLDATTVTRQVATMEADGLVRRKRHAHDGRVSLVELTALGRRRMESVRAARETRIADLVADWSERDQATFGRLLGRLNEAIRTRPPRDDGARTSGRGRDV
jgi:DNA-binding MarR family transcriptional regulator